MRELKLKYLIELQTNIAAKVGADLKALTRGQAGMTQAVDKTAGALDKADKAAARVGKTMVEATAKGTDQATRALGELGRQAQSAADKVSAIDRTLQRFGSNTSIERQTSYMRTLAGSMDAVLSRAGRLGGGAMRGMGMVGDATTGALAAGGAGYMGARAVVAPPLKAYASLEQATMDLRVAMTDAKGEVAQAFGRISDEAVKLGNELPGTTKDFMRAALALKANGTPDDVIANGGLRASAYLGVLLGLDQEQAAVTVAKTREAYGLKDTELVAAANAMQKARFAYGLKPTDLLAANTYASGMLNAQHWSGMSSMRQVLALQGLAAQRGIDGSVFGVDLKDFMTRLVLLDERLAKKSPEAKRARDSMKAFGVDLNVIGKDGYLLPPEQIVGEMQKLAKMPPHQRTAFVHTVFGEQAGQMANLLAQTDPGKFQELLAAQDNQGELNLRLAMTVSTLRNKFEALTGTIENLMAKLGEQLGNSLKNPIDRANDAAGGGMLDFVTNNPGKSTAGLLGATGFAAWLAARTGWRGWGALTGRAGAAAGAAAEKLSWPALEGVPGAASGGWTRALRGLPLVSVLAETMMTSPDEMATLRYGDMLRATEGRGYRGRGFADPRLVNNPALDPLAPNAGGAAGMLTGGTGKVEVDVRVTDDRVFASPRVTQAPFGFTLNAGNTNPGGN